MLKKKAVNVKQMYNINAKVNVSFIETRVQRSKITAYTGKEKGRCLRFG